MFGLKTQELLIILVILLLIFGARKLPDLARSLGASAKEFRKGVEAGASLEEPLVPSPSSDHEGDTPIKTDINPPGP